MARTTVNQVTAIAAYPTLPIAANSADLTLTALTGQAWANGNQIPFGNAQTLLLLVQNSDGAVARNITITSKADNLNRVGDLGPYLMQAGEFAVFTIKRSGFRQSDGYLYLESDNVAVKVAAIPIG